MLVFVSVLDITQCNTSVEAVHIQETHSGEALCIFIKVVILRKSIALLLKVVSRRKPVDETSCKPTR